MEERADNDQAILANVIQLKQQLFGEGRRRSIALSSIRVKEWMASENIEVLGAVYDLLTTPGVELVVRPAIVLEDALKFFLHYYGRCIQEDPDGAWSDSRYSAACDFGNLWKSWWKDSSIPRWVFDDAKDWLRRTYTGGSQEVRECIARGALGPLLADPEILSFFGDWNSDSVLKAAIELADA